MQLTRNSHFVPQAYLRRWSDGDQKVWCYRLLVSHTSVPTWKKHSIRGLAYQAHLYTTLRGTEETDEFERWIEREFETPGSEAIEKAVNDRRLTKADWAAIIGYAAAQDVRTPARYYESVARWNQELPRLLEDVLKESVEKWERAVDDERQAPQEASKSEAGMEEFPLKVSITPTPEVGGGIVKAETVLGRQMWVSDMRMLLTRTVQALMEHRWSLIRAPDGVTWLTSDDPVIKLNYTSDSEYSFGGGWGSRGSDIILPLSPTHVLYTQIGHRHPNRFTADARPANRLQRVMAEHAHRWIYSAERQDPRRQRVVDRERFRAEAQARQRWHSEQVKAELELKPPETSDGA
jgi:hypothetical protein